MFKLNAVKAFVVKIPSEGGIKACQMRYPTDAEWCERIRRLKVIRTSLGRDKHQADVPAELSANADLFRRIRIDGDGPEFDDYEAQAAIQRIDRCQVLNVTRHGNEFRIELDVPGGAAVHTARIPAQKDVAEYERGSLHLISSKRTTEIVSALEPAGVLYDKVCVAAEGYSGAVPIPHKYAVVRELLDQIDAVAADEEIEIPEA